MLLFAELVAGVLDDALGAHVRLIVLAKKLKRELSVGGAKLQLFFDLRLGDGKPPCACKPTPLRRSFC